LRRGLVFFMDVHGPFKASSREEDGHFQGLNLIIPIYMSLTTSITRFF